MSGQNIGYIRVSSSEQNTTRQLNGINLDKCFTDCLSGKNIKRPAFLAMLDYAREGDTIVVHSMDRFARSLKDLVNEIDKLVKRGIAIQFVKENIKFSAQSTPMDHLLLQLMGAFAEFEREIILERQKEGIRLAAAKGKYKGRVKKLSIEEIKLLKQDFLDQKYSSKAALAKNYGISRQTLYNYI